MKRLSMLIGVLLLLLASTPMAQLSRGTPPRRQQYNIKPFQILGNLSYVGLSDNTIFLIRSSEGYILLDTAAEDAEPEIRQNIESLGVKLRDIKILLQSHAHRDHVAGLAKFKASTGGRVVVMAEDAATLADGGASDFRNTTGEADFTPVTADQIIHDGDRVTLGDVTMVAHLTPGHTKGCTSWSMDTREAGRTYNIVFGCSMRINTNIRLLNNPKYPKAVADFEKGFKALRSLKPDLFFVSHGNQFGMAERLERMNKGEGVKAFMDGYGAYLDEYENAFIQQVKVEKAGGPPYAVPTKPLPPCPQDGRKCYGV